jgi:hypothetical protein
MRDGAGEAIPQPEPPVGGELYWQLESNEKFSIKQSAVSICGSRCYPFLACGWPLRLPPPECSRDGSLALQKGGLGRP